MRVYKGQELEPWRWEITEDSAHVWARVLEDPNPIHQSANAVARLGLGDRLINQGPTNIAYLINALEYNFPGIILKNMQARLVGMIHCGDIIQVYGVVEDISRDNETGSICLTVKLTACINTDDTAVEATITGMLQNNFDDPVRVQD